MPSRELQYRVIVNVGDAERGAKRVRSSIEKELRNIRVGRLDTQALKAAQADAKRYSDELKRAAQAAEQLDAAQRKVRGSVPGSGATGAAGNIASTFSGLQQTLGAVGIGLGIREIVRGIDSLTDLGTTAIRTEKAFTVLSGGANAAASNITAIQQAGGGAIDELRAMELGTQALSLKLADTPAKFNELVTAGRAVALVSPIINDVSGAISELGLASANVSFRRLDQLGLSVSEVRDRMRQLRAENESLDESQAFLAASIEILNSKYGEIIESEEARATALERLGRVARDAQVELAQGVSTGVNSILGPVADLIEGYEETEKIIVSISDARLQADKLAREGLSGADTAQQSYIDSIRETFDLWDKGALSAADYNFRILSLVNGLNDYTAAQEKAATAEQQAEDARQANILEQQQGAIDALNKQAQKSATTIGAEAAIEELRKEKALLDDAIQALIETGISDTGEIQIRIAEIVSNISQGFTDLEEAIGGQDIDFSAITGSLDQFNQSFVDFLPSMDDARDRLVALQAELSITGQLTDEQARQLDYLSAAASVAGGDAAFLDDVVNSLGESFLAADDQSAKLIDSLYRAAAAYKAGEISGGQFAGVVTTIGNRLLTLAEQAGASSGAIAAIVSLLNSVAGATGLAGFGQGTLQGGAIVSNVRTTEEENQRRAAREEAKRAAEDAAREQERAAKKAASDLEAGARKARQELESALQSVPGLFSRTQVTDKDLRFTKAGIYQDKADEYLRRLKAEVDQGKDIFSDVSIEDAKQALRDLGIQVADDAKIAFEQFTDAFDSQVLFSNPENIAKFINAEAVQRELDLQEKAKQGQENIFAAFGVAIDGYAAAAATGVQKAADAAVASVPIVGQLIPMGQTGGTIPTLGGLSTVVDIETIQGKLNDLTLPTFTADVANLADIQRQLSAIESIITVTATLADDVGAVLVSDLADQLARQIASFQSQGGTIGKIISDSIKASFDSVSGDQVVDTSIADRLIASIGQQLGERIARIGGIGEGVGDILRAGLIQELATVRFDGAGNAVAPVADGLIATIDRELKARLSTVGGLGEGVGVTLRAALVQELATVRFDDGEVATPIADGILRAINTEFSVRIDSFRREGETAAGTIRTALADAIGRVTWDDMGAVTPIADGLISAINTELRSSGAAFGREGIGPADAIRAGLADSLAMVQWNEAGIVSPVADGLISAINTQFRAANEDFRLQGYPIAGAILSGMRTRFDMAAEGDEYGIASALQTSVALQLETAVPMFTELGYNPATNIFSGMKEAIESNEETDLLVTPILSSIATAIRSNQDKFIQRGGTMARLIVQGISQESQNETLKNTMVAFGESLGAYIEVGILSRLSGSAIIETIGSAIMQDITDTLGENSP